MTFEAWKMGAYGAAVALVLGFIGWLMLSRANLKTELAEARADYAVCAAANREWAAKARESEVAMKKVQEETDRRAKIAAEAESRAAKKADKYTALAKTIIGKAAKGDECRAVRELVGDYIAGVRKP